MKMESLREKFKLRLLLHLNTPDQSLLKVGTIFSGFTICTAYDRQGKTPQTNLLTGRKIGRNLRKRTDIHAIDVVWTEETKTAKLQYGKLYCSIIRL